MQIIVKMETNQSLQKGIAFRECHIPHMDKYFEDI